MILIIIVRCVDIQQSVGNILQMIQYTDLDPELLVRNSELPYLPSMLQLCSRVIGPLRQRQVAYDPDVLEKVRTSSMMTMKMRTTREESKCERKLMY